MVEIKREGEHMALQQQQQLAESKGQPGMQGLGAGWSMQYQEPGAGTGGSSASGEWPWILQCTTW